MTQTLILKGKKDFWNRYPVYIRWSDGQKRTFKKTSLTLTKEQFEGFKKGEPGKDKELYRRFLSAMDESPAEQSACFYSYVDICLKEWRNDKAPETIRQITGEKSKLQKFRPALTLTDLTPAMLAKYKEYCEDKGNIGNTVWKSFKFLRLIVLKARREKLITENPFEVFKMPKYKDPQKQYLTEDEITELTAINDLPGEILFVKNWFLISCYTGLRFGDMVAFDRKKHIRNGRLVLYTSKTGEVVGMPLTDKVKSLFEAIEYRPVTFTNVHFNRLLKQVDAAKRLNAHKARHSFAVLCASKGISQEVTAKLMGHSSLKTTQIYYKLNSKRIDSEYGRLFE